MGCELCQNDNRENIEFKLAGDGHRPIEIKTKYNETNILDKDNYYSTLEERLNQKYSIPQKMLDEIKEKINNENNQLNSERDDLNNNNKNEYIINTLNIYSNNTIQFGSRNKNKLEDNKTLENGTTTQKKENTEKDNIFESDSNFRKDIKNEEEIEELKNNLRNDKLREKSNKRKNNNESQESNNITGNENENEKSERKKRHKEKSKEKTKEKNKDKSKEKSTEKSKKKSEEKNKEKTKEKKKKEKERNKEKSKSQDKHSSRNKHIHKDKESSTNRSHSRRSKKSEKKEKSDKYSEDDYLDKEDDYTRKKKSKKDTMTDDDKEQNEKFSENSNEKSEKNSSKNKEKSEDDNNDNSEIKSKSSGKIKYSYTKQISKNTQKINLLLKGINHSKIDKIIKDAPKREKTTLEKLIQYFVKNSKKLSLVERAWLVYKWITLNIEYDFEGVNAYNYDISEEATFKRGKSICSGYAGLYKKISDNLELTVERIGGFSKGFNFKITEEIEDSEKHEWNAVQIEDDWFFIESTWGAGYSTDQKTFIKKFNPYYFFTPPQEFVRGHLPFDAKWQLLPKTKKISQQAFMAFAPLKSDFFTLGFHSIDPDYTFNDVKEKGKIILYFEKFKEINPEKLKVMGKLYLIEGENNTTEIKNSILEIRKEDCFEVNYLINKKGEYKLKIFGSDGSSEEYNELCTLILTTEKDAAKPKTYPSTSSLYRNSDMKIIHPNNGSFKEGNKVTFEFKTSTFDKLFIGIKTKDGANFTEMNKENNIFKEEDFLIYGQKILISCKGEKENSYNSILEFEVNPITSKKSTITFPQVFAGPKNKLIEPICDKLKKGKKVNFSIKCDLIEEMVVFDGDDLHKLKNNNGIFTGSVKISGKGEVKIAFKKEQGYGVLYLYKVF